MIVCYHPLPFLANIVLTQPPLTKDESCLCLKQRPKKAVTSSGLPAFINSASGLVAISTEQGACCVSDLVKLVKQISTTFTFVGA